MTGLGLSAAVVLPSALAAGPPSSLELFTLIVEGTSTAKRTFNESGATGPCKVNVHGTLTETATYQRGRGVTVAAARNAGGTIVFRAGTQFNRDITTRVRVIRMASGSVSYTPLAPQFAAVCRIIKGIPDLSKLGCPEKHSLTADWGIKGAGSSFALRQADVLTNPNGPARHGPGSCAYSNLTEGFLELRHEYPDIPEVNMVPIPTRKIFGHRHAFLVHMTSGNVVDPTQKLGTPPLTGTTKDSGRTDVLLRFIRQP